MKATTNKLNTERCLAEYAPLVKRIAHHMMAKLPPCVQLDDIIQVSDGDSILMAQKMAATLGLAVGISSGANILGAIKIQQEGKENENAVVVTILADSNKKYLSTDLLKEEPVKEGYLSGEIEMLDYMPIARAFDHN